MDAQPFAETQQFFVKQRCAPRTCRCLLAHDCAWQYTQAVRTTAWSGARRPICMSSTCTNGRTRSLAKACLPNGNLANC